jgi:hypothetical protein
MSALEQDLGDLLLRFRAELDYSDAKGAGPYREGMHDGLHFAVDALSDVLTAHGLDTAAVSANGEIPREYGVRT